MPLKQTIAHKTLQQIQATVQRSMAESQHVNHLIECYLRSIGLTVDRFRKDLEGWNLALEEKILREWKGTSEVIPKTTHRIWITEEGAPVMPPEDYVSRIASNLSEVTWDCVNYFWVNDAAVAEFLSERFSSINAIIFIKHISGLSSDRLYESANKLIVQKKFVFSTDLLRVIVVKQFGGIYADFGITFSRELMDVAGLTQYLCLLGDETFLQTSLFGAYPSADITNIYHAVLCNPGVIPVGWLGEDCDLSGSREVNTLAGPGFTALVHLFKRLNQNILVVRNDGIILKWSSHASWYGNEAKFKNVLVSDTKASILSAELMAKHRENVGLNIRDYGLPLGLAVRLKILIGLSDYFNENPTRLCEIMYFYGSDKAMSWHNYTYIYNYLFPCLSDCPGSSILEIGIGTNFLDVPSSMGLNGVPGASLRGWREFLGVEVYGADVDKRILFRDNGINTFYVDQLDINSIDNLWTSVEVLPSIVIDDGLHTFEANTNVFKSLVRGNKKAQLFVIEDVLDGDIESWVTFLKDGGVASAILKIPSHINRTDNNLVVVSLSHATAIDALQ